MGRVNKIKLVYSVFSICLVILGAVMIIKPNMAASLFCRICGALLVLFGITKLVGYFSRDSLQLAFQFDLAMGIAGIILGFLMFFWWRQFLEFAIISIGLFMLVDALLRIQTAFDAQRIGVKQWWMILAIAVITAIIGTMLFLKPYQGSKLLVILIGVSMIVDGILNLYVVQTTVSPIEIDDLYF